MPSLKDRVKSLLAKRKKTTDSPQPTTSSTPKQDSPGQVPSQQPAVHPPTAREDAQQQPIVQELATAASAPAPSSGMLKVLLQNPGSAIDRGGALFLLQSDAKTAYYPASPSATGTALAQNVSIPLGAPGNTVTATIPRLAGGRIWMSVDAPLVFKVNPGPGLVEPSVFNQSDPNINTNFGFAEFTFNSAQVFANISYVDFVGAPISLTLTDTSGKSQHVSGLPANGLDTICNGLKAQTAKDNRRWSSLIVTKNGKNLRALSPNSAGYGNVNGETNSAGALNFGAGGTFAKPSARDIFSCSTGPFATGNNPETNVIIPRLAAAFNRSTLLLPNGNTSPNGVPSSQYYSTVPTNVRSCRPEPS
nr:glucan endo-1,3-beta-glucosidase [Quercus suber]